MARLSTGMRHPRNLSADTKGSIHDDNTAQDLGFRGGTVAGDIHLEQFGGICVEGFGNQWFENGFVSMYFQQVTTDNEPVDAYIDGEGTLRTAGIVTPEGAVVAEGNIGIGDNSSSALNIRDRRDVNPSTLRMMKEVRVGQPTDLCVRYPNVAGQMQRVNSQSMTSPLDWYSQPSPWGGPICSPLTACQLLVANATDSIAAACGPFVGMYGAIEVRHINGPLFLDVEYVISGEVLAVSETPKTEVLWFRTQARPSIDPEGPAIAEVTMMTRLLKASSPLYA